MKKNGLIAVQRQYEISIENDFHITLKQYLEMCKRETSKCNVNDYKIEQNHDIDEYLLKYGGLLKQHKLLAYRKDELWTMNKKTTYWEIPNETSLYYFAIPYQNKLTGFFSLCKNWFLAQKAITIPATSLIIIGGIVGGLFASGLFTINKASTSKAMSIYWSDNDVEDYDGCGIKYNIRCDFYENNQRSDILPTWYPNVDEDGRFVTNLFFYSSATPDVSEHTDQYYNIGVEIKTFCLGDNPNPINLTQTYEDYITDACENKSVVGDKKGFLFNGVTIGFDKNTIKDEAIVLNMTINFFEMK